MTKGIKMMINPGLRPGEKEATLNTGASYSGTLA